MSLTIEIRFLLDRFEGSDGHDADPPEWPPSPARVFSALVAGCEAEAGDALRWLERQGPPLIDAGESEESRPPARWMVTNARYDKVGGNPDYPGRTNVLRPRARRLLEREPVTIRWPQAQPTAGQLQSLQSAAANVAYIGRPTSPAVVRVHGDELAADGRTRWEPASTFRADAIDLRLPYPGFLDALVAAHDVGGRVDPPVSGRYVEHRENGLTSAQVVASPWTDLLVLPLESEGMLDGRTAVRLTSSARRSVTTQLAETFGEAQVHPALTGHREEGHVAWLALPFADHEQADGRIMALGIALPDADPTMVRQLRAVLGAGSWTIDVPSPAGRGKLRFRHLPSERNAAWSARATRWQRPSRSWRTVLPAVLDVAPRRELSEADAVVRTVVNAGYPEPLAVQVERGPIVAGDLALRPSETRRRRGERVRPYRHLRIVFSEPVQGPVVVGAMRHFGLGLCTQDEAPADPMREVTP